MTRKRSLQWNYSTFRVTTSDISSILSITEVCKTRHTTTYSAIAAILEYFVSMTCETKGQSIVLTFLYTQYTMTQYVMSTQSSHHRNYHTPGISRRLLSTLWASLRASSILQARSRFLVIATDSWSNSSNFSST